MDLERLYGEDHTFFEVVVGDFSAKIVSEERLKNPTSGLTEWNGMSRIHDQDFTILRGGSTDTLDVKRSARQGDTIPPRLFSTILENIIRHSKWEDLGVKVNGRYLLHLRFADDIVLITPNIEQAERMLAEFDNACGKIGLRLNLTKTMFMKKRLVPDAPFTLNGKNISECSSYMYLGQEVNMMNDLDPELCKRKRAAWGAFKNIEREVKKTENTPAQRPPLRHCCPSCFDVPLGELDSRRVSALLNALW
uniref:RNA-directed DNA polymerase (Reverse transcriptase) domain containing protein n=1 Tax=Haemonchus contortus TaxID=6289 RepID=W6NEW2_HAECO